MKTIYRVTVSNRGRKFQTFYPNLSKLEALSVYENLTSLGFRLTISTELNGKIKHISVSDLKVAV